MNKGYIVREIRGHRVTPRCHLNGSPFPSRWQAKKAARRAVRDQLLERLT